MNATPRPALIRPAVAEDLPAIRAIYNHYVAASTCTFALAPESEEERREWFSNRSTTHPVLVALEGEEVLAWASLSAWKGRCAYTHTVESSVYVHPAQHRRGLGTALMRELVAMAGPLGVHTIIAGVCSEQAASIALHERLGFEKVAHFRQVGFKFGRWLDVIYFQKFF